MCSLKLFNKSKYETAGDNSDYSGAYNAFNFAGFGESW
jgi:hypothetical protein